MTTYIKLDDVDISTNEKLVQFLLEDPVVTEDINLEIHVLFIKFKKHRLSKFEKVGKIWCWVPLVNFKFMWIKGDGFMPESPIQIVVGDKGQITPYIQKIEELGELN